MKNELGGSATQQELRGWGVGGSQWNEQGNWGLNPPNPIVIFSNPARRLIQLIHPTETAVVKVYDIITALDADLITALFLLDFSSAFDCVDPSILMQVLELKFGITASALKRIASFLTGKTHLVRVGTRTSKVCNILFGVP